MADKLSALMKVFEEGLKAWRTFISTRQEAYNRQMDKRKRLAIDCAEKYILLNKDWRAEQDAKERNRINSKMAYWERKFFKLNQ